MGKKQQRGAIMQQLTTQSNKPQCILFRHLKRSSHEQKIPARDRLKTGAGCLGSLFQAGAPRGTKSKPPKRLKFFAKSRISKGGFAEGMMILLIEWHRLKKIDLLLLRVVDFGSVLRNQSVFLDYVVMWTFRMLISLARFASF